MNYQQPNNGYMPSAVPSTPSIPSQTANLVGRCVNDFGEITATDVPMNGIAVFPKMDRSEIQVREWSPTGQITTTSYKAVLEQKPSDTTNVSNEVQNFKFDAKSEVLEPIFDRLAELEQKLDKLSRPTTANKTTKKEGE